MNRIEEIFPVEIGGKLGEGSYGRVHECTLGGKEVYAVKILKKTSNEIESLFELSIMATYRHPHLSHAIKIIQDQNHIYVVQDVAVCDLEQFMKLGRYFDKKKWFISLLQAVKFLHSKNIIHCDIKPLNVLVFKDDTLKLTDYSHSVLTPEPNVFFRWKVGSPRYSAPEVLDGRLWSNPIDIWSLGCVFYELSTKVRFLSTIPSKASDRKIVETIKSREFTRATFEDSDDRELILDYMLQFDPKDRYPADEILNFYYEEKEPLEHQVVVFKGKRATSASNLLGVIKNKTKNPFILKLTQEIHERAATIPLSLLKIEACYALATKILNGATPIDEVLSLPGQLLEMQFRICTEIGFLLH